MANLFQIGYGGGPPKAIDYSKALDPLAKKIGAKLKESKAKTDTLINNMPQGVPIDKVPEQLRGQVTDFLTQNKQAYVDASKVIASGIPSTDQRYIDAVSTINQVDAKFKNLSNTLEDIALKRQAALDGRDHSDGSFDWEIGDHEDLANGNMYSKFTLQDDGGFNYQSNNGVTKSWKDYSNTFQTNNAGQEGFFSLEEMALKDGDNGRDFNRRRFENRFDSLTKGLKNKGARDFVFSDNDFIASKTGFEVGTEEFEKAKKELVNKGNFDEILVEYKKYGVDELEKLHKIAKNKYTANLSRGGRTNMVILDGFGQITEKQAIAKAKKMGVEGDVSYDARNLRKFVNIGGGKTQIYLQDDQGGYETKGELISTNEALALRGLDGVGISFDELVIEDNSTSWEDAPGEELKGGDMGERTGAFGVRGIPLYTRPKE